MKRLIILSLLFFSAYFAQAQLLKRITDRAKEKVNQKIDQKVDKTIDDAVDGNGKKKTEKKVDSVKNTAGSTAGNAGVSSSGSSEATASSAESGTLKSYSKYDFVPGDKVIVEEDFAQDAIGDFPDKWNTNGSGEIVTVEGQQGHWLMISKKGRFIPEYINNLPENFTLQFDLMCNEKFSFYSNALGLFLLTGENSKKALEYSFIPMEKRSGVRLGFHPTSAANNGGTVTIQNFEDGESGFNNEVATKTFSSFEGRTKIKVSIWRQKQRIRVYLNEEKVLDLPRAFPANKTYSTVMFEIWSGMNNETDRYLVNNIKLAVGSPDTRNKLITEGKFVTRGILFDVNSDRIKPESYGVLKEISTVLTDNATVRVKIIGHTDSDGDDKSNLDLSKRRAEAVKAALSKEFGIDASRMESDGKGESQPADKNDSPAGKANNRRVEFVKL